MDITLEDIKDFSKKYNANPVNKIIENAITNNGIENTMLDRKIIAENQPVFNIELPESTRYDQKDSYKCWIFAGLNVIKYDIANHLNIDVKDLKLSNDYIAFFDKLEKANGLYNRIIELKDVSYKFINKERVITYAVEEAGCWEWFRGIVNKYGLVPHSVMTEARESVDYNRITTIYKEKVLGDVTKLIQLKEKHTPIEKLQKQTKTFMAENYTLLSKILGEPVQQFTYEYKDKEGKLHRLENITPIEFRETFLKLDLNEFVHISNIPKYDKEYGKVYELENYYQIEKYRFLNLPMKELKKIAIKQLKDHTPIWMSIYIHQFRNEKSEVLDTRLFDYQKVLNIKPLSKEDGLNTDYITSHHAMVISGVHIVNNKPVRWKVEDSYGDKEKHHGCYIMNDNYFDRYVFGIIVNKKYLSQEQVQQLQQKPIKYID